MDFLLEEDNSTTISLEDGSGTLLLESSSGATTYTLNNPVMVIG